jgi:hypothetical protein
MIEQEISVNVTKRTEIRVRSVKSKARRTAQFTRSPVEIPGSGRLKLGEAHPHKLLNRLDMPRLAACPQLSSCPVLSTSVRLLAGACLAPRSEMPPSPQFTIDGRPTAHSGTRPSPRIAEMDGLELVPKSSSGCAKTRGVSARRKSWLT